jgi:hypothetical protein
MQLDQKLLAEMRANLERTPQREALAAVSNIKSDEVLDKLLDLGINAETYAAITYVPLAAVAWADGTIEDSERRAVLDAALQHGVKAHGMGYMLLEKWLEHPPGPQLMQVWKSYIHELRKSVDPSWMDSLKTEIMQLASGVAEAAGGILGLIQKTSPSEKRKLAELAKVFDGP